jgi:phosphopantetheinyl transferase
VPLPLAPDAGAAAAWLEAPDHPMPSPWESALEMAWLDDEERDAIRAAGGPPQRRRQRTWGRIAAKEAALRLWESRGGIPIAPLGLHAWSDERGRPHLRVRPPHILSTPPVVGIAHHGRVAVALAAAQPWTHAGIDVEAIAPRSSGFEALAFAEEERQLLGNLPDRDEWSARLWCAKEAAAKATGWGLAAGPPSVIAVDAAPGTGLITLRLGEAIAAYCPRLAGRDLVAHTDRRGDLAWGWVLCREGSGRP